MTFENRLPANYSFGTLTSAAAISDTTLTSTDFSARLASSLSTTNYVPLTLQDPSTGNFEVVWVSAHTAAASTATVVRGKEGTSARAWGTGTLWVCAPTLRDAVLPVSTRSALPTDPHVGLRAFIQDEQVVVERLLTTWSTRGGQLWVTKTANESVTSSTTLQNDDHLLLAVDANATYILDAYIAYVGAVTPAGDMKIDWTVPAGATMKWSAFGPNSNAITSYDVVTQAAAGTRAIATLDVPELSLAPKGYLVTAGTAGTLQMRWAQNASSATATTIKAGSWIRLVKVA